MSGVRVLGECEVDLFCLNPEFAVSGDEGRAHVARLKRGIEEF